MRLLVLFHLLLMLGFAAPAVAVCVKVPKANLREEPNKNAAESWTVAQYMPLKVVGKNKSKTWLEVQDLDNEKHWIFGGLVDLKLKCVVVRTSYSYLFQGPGYQYPKAKIAIVDRYTPFKQIGRKKQWLQVEDDRGEKYWINSANVWAPTKEPTKQLKDL